MTDAIATLGEPVTDATEASLMQAEYGLLLNKVIGTCDGTQPAVAIAACISAAFCVAVDATPVESADSAKRYIQACLADAFASIDRAFAAKAGASNGDDTGEQSEGSHQEVAND
jgi:hypothetical protein